MSSETNSELEIATTYEQLADGRPRRITRELWESRTCLHHGDWVMARTRPGAKPWPARIELVNGNLCPTRRQKRVPHGRPHDFDFKWPVFFYGTHKLAWVSERLLKRMKKEDNPMPEFDPAFRSGTPYQKAVFEFHTKPWVLLDCWANPDGRWEDDCKKKIESPRYLGWHRQIPPHDKFIPEHWKGLVREDESETEEQSEEHSEEDPIQLKYELAKFKLKDLEVGDIVGAVYPNHNNDWDYFLGVVKRKDDETSAIDVNYARYCRTTAEYVEDKKDSDRITIERQGYLYFHEKKENVDFKTNPSNSKLLFSMRDEYFQRTLRTEQLTWKVYVAKMTADEDGATTAQAELYQHLERIKDIKNMFKSSTRARVTEV